MPWLIALPLSLPSHVRFHVAQGYTLSMAKQVLSGHVDTVIKTVERNVPVRASLQTGMMIDTFIFFIKSPVKLIAVGPYGRN